MRKSTALFANLRLTQHGRSPDERAAYQRDEVEFRDSLRRLTGYSEQEFAISSIEALKRVATMRPLFEITAVVFLFGYVVRGSGRVDVRCYFANSSFHGLKSTYAISELVATLRSAGYESVYLFIILDEDPSTLKLAPAYQEDGICIFLGGRIVARIFLAVAAEIVSWDGCENLLRQAPTFSSIAKGAVELVGILCSHGRNLDERIKALTYNGIVSSRHAWEISRSVEFVNFKKILSGRPEQMLDEINRMIQLAGDSEYASQISFLFCQLPEETKALAPEFHLHLAVTHAAFGTVSSLEALLVDDDAKDPGPDKLGYIWHSFIPIPEGEFIMGENHSFPESEPTATPRHVVFSDSFFVMRTVLTVEMARVIDCQDSGSSPDSLPYVNLSLLDSIKMARRLTTLLRKYYLIPPGWEVRVPSEVQWEKSARGTDGRAYPWGNPFELGRCNSISSGMGKPINVASYSPLGDSPYGCCDMAGNVREWTRSSAGVSIRAPSLYPCSSSREIMGVGSEARLQAIVRGGSYSYEDECVRCWVRNKELASRRRPDTGVRFICQQVQFRSFFVKTVA
jgi:formylglycine-generating enzyme required for sulfatase activity